MIVKYKTRSTPGGRVVESCVRRVVSSSEERTPLGSWRVEHHECGFYFTRSGARVVLKRRWCLHHRDQGARPLPGGASTAGVGRMTTMFPNLPSRSCAGGTKCARIFRNVPKCALAR